MIPYATAAEVEAALGRAMTWAEAMWFRYSAAMPDYWLYCHTFVIVLLVYTIAPLPLLLFESFAPGVVLPYKLQPRVRSLPPAASFRCYINTACKLTFSVGPLVLVSYPATVKIMGIQMGLPLPSFREIATQLLVYALVDDYLNYWIHRFLHTKWGYTWIHHVHHEFTTPIGFSSTYAHWADILIVTIPALVGVAIVPCHIAVQWLWFSIRLIGDIDKHSGYNFPFSPDKIIPFYGGAEFHDYHHYIGGHSQGNFASFFTHCDYIYGTDKGYKYHKARLAKMVLILNALVTAQTKGLSGATSGENVFGPLVDLPSVG
ncbi:hypothetical protein ACP70R_003809 [Stipagrostis hirtigluma subsp. patula]